MSWTTRLLDGGDRIVVEGGFETIETFPEASSTTCSTLLFATSSSTVADDTTSTMTPRLEPTIKATTTRMDSLRSEASSSSAVLEDDHGDDMVTNNIVRKSHKNGHNNGTSSSSPTPALLQRPPPPLSASTSWSSVSSIPKVPSVADLEKGSTKPQSSPWQIGKHETSLNQRRRIRSIRSMTMTLPRQEVVRHYFLPVRIPKLHPTHAIPLLNFIDMFAVSLVVPLLFQYYKTAGVTSASQRELLSSIFSISQIVGGLVLGILTDAHLVERKTILLLSFGGSAISYALIVCCGGLYSILISRMLVGLVKQTMTVCTTLLTQCTNKENRAQILGRLTASSTISWIIGPTVGALLYKYVDPRAPALLACLLFVLNLVLAMMLLDHDPHESTTSNTSNTPKTTQSQYLSSSSSATSKCVIIYNNLRNCFSSKALGSAVVTKLLVTWVTKTTNYSQLGSFYEDMYGLEPHHRGYISSYQQLLQFLVNVRLVAPVLNLTGGERPATLYCVSVMALAVYLESQRSLILFLLVLCPIISLSFCISDLSLQTLVTHVAPQSSMFSVLAALDVLQNAVSVSVPFYRTWLFQHLQRDTSHNAMHGDPDPVAWVQASALHWLLAAIILSILLTRESWWKELHYDHDVTPPQKKGH